MEKLDTQIDKIKEKHDEIKEKQAALIFQERNEIDLLIKERDLVKEPSRLSAFFQELSNDILMMESRPDYAGKIREKWQVLQKVFDKLVQDDHQHFSDIKSTVISALEENQTQRELDQYEVKDLNELLQNQPPQQKQQLEKQLSAKAQKIKVREEYSNLLQKTLAKIPSQEKTANVDTKLDIKSPAVVIAAKAMTGAEKMRALNKLAETKENPLKHNPIGRKRR